MKLETFKVLRDLHARLLLQVNRLMSAQTDALKAVVATIVGEIQAAITNEGQLKSKLDAALADNVAKAATIADLQAQLAAAQSNPADTAAVVDATAQLQAVAQPLADANAVNAPGN